MELDEFPLIYVIGYMHSYLRDKMHISYYASSKICGLRAETIKYMEKWPGKGQVSSLVVLMNYYRENYRKEFDKAIKIFFEV